jgi:hypothetical protein
MWNIAMIYCFNARLNKIHDFEDSYSGGLHAKEPYIYEFKGFLENRQFLIPGISLLHSVIHTVLIHTLWQKKLYFYPISHGTGIISRIVLLALLCNITKLVSFGYEPFLFIIGCSLAIFTAFTVCLFFYLVKKLVRCRPSKHTLFTLVLSLFCIGNNLFLYLTYNLFDGKDAEPAA